MPRWGCLSPPYFYPRSPCGERLHLFSSSGVDFSISIHALLAESDDTSKDTIKTVNNFYPRSPCGERPTSNKPFGRSRLFLSTLSLRRATTLMAVAPEREAISIHALLAESDELALTRQILTTYFYPRSPCGERRKLSQSSAAARGISIHALLAESDRRMLLQAQAPRNFYPRSPCGERLGNHCNYSP